MRAINALLAALLVGVLAAAGEMGGIALGMAIGGKAEIIVSGVLLLLVGTAAGALAARRTLTPALSASKLLAASVAVVSVVGLVLRWMGESLFEGHAVNPLYLALPAMAIGVTTTFLFSAAERGRIHGKGGAG
jgi:hypothetical protein